MNLQLQVSDWVGGRGHVPERFFKFAVIDFDKADLYPLNFVCMLPMKINLDSKTECKFREIFGDRSVIVARTLLHEALKRETNAEVKTEIERRVKLLKQKPKAEKRCLSCGKIFEAKSRYRFKQKYCPECIKKKYGGRT